MHNHIKEAYDVRDGKLYRNDRLANQVASQPLHYTEEQRSGPKMLTSAAILIIALWGIAGLCVYLFIK
ncbi:MAG: hypothetical protein WBQ94_03640 [Terracidiphilus sp.]